MKKIALLVALFPSMAFAHPFDRPKVTENNRLQVAVQDRVDNHLMPDGKPAIQIQSLFSVQLPNAGIPIDSPFRPAQLLKMDVQVNADVGGRSETFKKTLDLKNMNAYNPDLKFFADGTASNAMYLPAGATVTSRKVFIRGPNGAEYTDYGRGVAIAVPPEGR